jgi:hypothetical protein
MDTFTLRLPWWPVLRLFSRNPLVRTVDRVEAVFVLGAVLVSLLAAPFAAAALGTGVHDARSHLSTEQAQSRHAVAATVTDVHGTGSAPPPRLITAPVRGVISGREYSVRVDATPSAQAGNRAWIDDDGRQVDQPTALSGEANDAVVAALVMWVTVIAAAAGLVAVARAILNHVRKTGWQHDLDNLLCRGGGQANTRP